MAQAVRWRTFFAGEQTNTQYRVDIYDTEGDWQGPILLDCDGENPFVTNEDNSDDFFAGIRSQSGTLRIITKIPKQTLLPDGGYIDIKDIVPMDNISHFVRVVNTSVNNKVEWQGFLSCEAYNQDYIGIPQVLDLPLISVLEALDSLEVENREDRALKTIVGHAVYALYTIQQKIGMSIFGDLYIPEYCFETLTTKLFYNNAYYSTNEVISGENVIVEVHSQSCKKILEQIAAFFGCCWREDGQDIYLEVVGKALNMRYKRIISAYDEYVSETATKKPWQTHAQQSYNMEDIDWMGTNHQQCVSQGMRRIKLQSKLQDFECDLALIEGPINTLVENPSERHTQWGEVHCNTNETFYNLAEHKHWLYDIDVVQDSSLAGKHAVTTNDGSTPSILYQRTWNWQNDTLLDNYAQLFQTPAGLVGTNIFHAATSYMSWVRIDGKLMSGLMVYGIPHTFVQADSVTMANNWAELTQNDYVFTQKTPLIFAAYNGKLVFDMNLSGFMTNIKFYQQPNSPASSTAHGVDMAIRWGNKWASYNGSSWSWSNTFTTFAARSQRENSFSLGYMHYEIPITDWNVGIVQVYIYPRMYGAFSYNGINDVHALFITNLRLKYEPVIEELKSERGTNAYLGETGMAFRDELSKSLQLSSYVRNTKLATMIYEDATTPIEVLNLGGVSVRPEIDLLQRLVEYYSATRNRLDLIGAPLSNIITLQGSVLNGINDGKQYLPLSLSREWKPEVVTYTCIETPNVPGES